MITFTVQDMTCNHCASSITEAVRSVDDGARVAVDLPTHVVRIEGGREDAAALRQAIEQAGFTPVPA
jgi:copper chaperone